MIDSLEFQFNLKIGIYKFDKNSYYKIRLCSILSELENLNIPYL